MAGFSVLFLITVFLFSLFWYLIKFIKRPVNIPPGPKGLPIFGSLFSIGSDLEEFLKKQRKRHGDIFSVYFGDQLNVIISDFDTVKEAFLKRGEYFSARPLFEISMEVLRDETGKIFGLTSIDGKAWKEQRKFALSKLRDLGVGKSSIEYKIKEEVSAFINECKRHQGAPFDVENSMSNCVSNIICSISFGARFDYDDPEFKKLNSYMNDILANGVVFYIADFLPWSRYLPYFCDKVRDFLEKDREITAFIKKRVKEHIVNHDPTNPQDLIDHHLNVIKQNEFEGIEGSSFSVKQVEATINDLFFAGTVTTSTTLCWAFLYMLKHPEIMRKVQAEIDNVIGRNRLPCYADKAKMGYTEAVLNETQRIGNIVPTGLPHATSQTVTLKGYTIPAGTIVRANLSAILMDPKMFPEPHEFRPNRFLDENENFVKCETIIPFSVGRRVCLGETLAIMELFLLFTSILQNLDLRLPEGVTEVDTEPVIGLTAAPKPFLMRMIPRQESKQA